MKTKLLKVVSILITMTVLLSACGKSNGKINEGSDGKGASEKALDIMFVVTGNLGGGTNNDDVHKALSDYTKANGGSVNTFECNMDTSLYESTLMQAAETGKYDLIVTGFGTMIEPLGNTAAKYPNQKFLIFDTEMDYKDGKNSNVISVQVLQNEAGFLAGVLAAMMTTSDIEFANDKKVVGFVGAMESTAVLDLLVSYIQGVNYIDPSIEVLYSFVGDHKDSALTKEMALSQSNSGADVVFGVTNSDLAVADAALSNNFYAICVDADEAINIAGTSKETAERIVTSVIKAYYNMVNPIVEQIGNGTAKWGAHMKISYAEGGVSLADNQYFQAIATKEMQDKLVELKNEISSGKIVVNTAYGASTEEVDKIKALAPAQK